MRPLELEIEAIREMLRAEPLATRAIECCRAALEACAREEAELGHVPLEGWLCEQIVPRFRRHALIFAHSQLDEPFVETVLELLRADDGDEEQSIIGSYRLITGLDGELEDDYLTLDVPAPNEETSGNGAL